MVIGHVYSLGLSGINVLASFIRRSDKEKGEIGYPKNISFRLNGLGPLLQMAGARIIRSYVHSKDEYFLVYIPVDIEGIDYQKLSRLAKKMCPVEDLDAARFNPDYHTSNAGTNDDHYIWDEHEIDSIDWIYEPYNTQGPTLSINGTIYIHWIPGQFVEDVLKELEPINRAQAFTENSDTYRTSCGFFDITFEWENNKDYLQNMTELKHYLKKEYWDENDGMRMLAALVKDVAELFNNMV